MGDYRKAAEDWPKDQYLVAEDRWVTLREYQDWHKEHEAMAKETAEDVPIRAALLKRTPISTVKRDIDRDWIAAKGLHEAIEKDVYSQSGICFNWIVMRQGEQLRAAFEHIEELEARLAALEAKADNPLYVVDNLGLRPPKSILG